MLHCCCALTWYEACSLPGLLLLQIFSDFKVVVLHNSTIVKSNGGRRRVIRHVEPLYCLFEVYWINT